MVSTSKILTVSYGTFSCTLEGFDDSFDTMKAIAEYFRDLAADDRYFGAEPPTPDADMLARIAEREIARRVEAHEENGKVHLRAALNAPEPAPAPAAPAAAVAAAAVTAATTDWDDEDEADSVAPETVSATDDTLDAFEAEDTVYAEAEEQDAPPEAEEPVQVEPEIAFEDDDEPQLPEEAAPQPSAENVAAKLQRIRAVVAKAEAEPEPEYTEDEHAEEFLDEADLEEILTESGLREDPAADLEEEIAPRSSLRLDPALFAQDDSEEDAAPEAAPTTMSDWDEDDYEDDWDDTAQDEAEPEVAVEPEPAPAPVAPRPRVARVVKVKRSDFEKAVAQGLLEEEEDAPAPSSSLSPEDEADLQRELAAVEAELRGELPAEPSQDTWQAEEPYEEDGAALQAAAADWDDEDDASDEWEQAQGAEDDWDDEDDDEDEPAAASDDQEDDWEEDSDEAALAAIRRRRLADIDEDRLDQAARAAGMGGEALYEEDEPEPAPQNEGLAAQIRSMARRTVKMTSEGRTMLTQRPVEDGESVSRLMEETDAQMGEPDSNRRRNAIQHLRAAVAATKADKDMARDDEAESLEPYRDDLNEVVRPRRPAAGEGRSERPAVERPAAVKPAPLKLVAEQRVDTPSAPVRPRRVDRTAVVKAAPEEIEGSFAEFAEEVGAVDLPDLLEAAAAYMSFVEGREQFSRPQLMTKVRSVTEDDFSREDGLRSFGQLLREGKIEKTKGGRFTVSEQISFKPDERAVG